MAQRFDDSFLARLIREFFVLLVLVAVIELLIRLGIELVDFHVEVPHAVSDNAEQLAADVKSLMLNDGGPVAAKTMYPILEKTHARVGYDIAIVPSDATVSSMKKIFDFTPRGFPARWPEGIHHAARIELRAEKFCVSCHVDAGVGDVLGHVEVRKYLFEDVSRWWDEIQLTAVAGMGKIILHTIVLYLLLRIRMEPLNSLRGLVSRLARSGTRLEERVPIRSNDEFGQLADDMNAFLDRVTGITSDVESVLDRITSLDARLQEVRARIEQQTDRIRQRLEADHAGGTGLDSSVLEGLRGTIEALSRQLPEDDPLAARMDASARALESLAERQSDVAATDAAEASLQGDFATLSRHVAEMAVLEERMQAIAEEGTRLLGRLVGPGEDQSVATDDAR